MICLVVGSLSPGLLTGYALDPGALCAPTSNPVIQASSLSDSQTPKPPSRDSFSVPFNVDSKILDIYLSADCTGFISCGAWMCLISAVFHCILYSDMVSDEVGFQYTYAFWAISFSTLLAIFLVQAFLIRKYIPKLQLASSKLSSSFISNLSDTIVALRNLCIGDGDMPLAPSTFSSGSAPDVDSGLQASEATEDASKPKPFEFIRGDLH
jgi:hypothetical protein